MGVKFIRNEVIIFSGVDLGAYEKVKKIHTEWCKRCEEKYGKKDIDECFKCPFHKLFNEIYEELNHHG